VKDEKGVSISGMKWLAYAYFCHTFLKNLFSMSDLTPVIFIKKL